jgi:DHA1 family bicyclomycin/chloramphenicol resistance-like MFS transporter
MPLHHPQPTAKSRLANLPGWLILLGGLIAIGPLSIDMYLPAFPALAAEFAHQPWRPEYTLSSYFIGMAIGQLVYGPISDRFGRKPPLYAGLLLYTLASLAGALAGDLISLAAWRFIQALGGCAGIVITRAVVRDRCDVRDSARAFSMLMLVMGIAPILAPLAGGWVVAHLGWRAIFWLLAGFGAICLLAMHVGLTESHDTRHAQPLNWQRSYHDYLGLLREPAFMGYSLSSGLAMAGFFTYLAGSPHVLIELYGIPAQDYGLVFGGNAFGFVFASQLNARLMKTMQPTYVLRRAMRTMTLAALVLLALSTSMSLPPLWLVLPLLLVIISSLGFIMPNANAAALAIHGQLAGTASALIGSLQFGLATVAGMAMGASHSLRLAPMVTIMAVCILSAWLVHRQLLGKGTSQ